MNPTRTLRSRARRLLAREEPEACLYVGSSAARFAEAARKLSPYTAFDGLDAEARAGAGTTPPYGRLDAAVRGDLLALAPVLAGRYDALCLVHYLERRPDPRAELRAAQALLRPGGHLLIDCADPRSPNGRLLGGTWWRPQLPYGSAQLLSLAELRAELEELGFTVLVARRPEAHVPCDLAAALAFLLARLLPAQEAATPWPYRFPPPPRRRSGDVLSSLAGALLAPARLADHLLAPLLAHTGLANSYRVLARREEPGTAFT